MTQPDANHSDKPRRNAEPHQSTTDPAVAPIDDQLAKVRFGLLAKHRWAVFVVPFVVYMLLGQLETAPPSDPASTAAEATDPTSSRQPADAGPKGLTTSNLDYPVRYALRNALTIATILFVMPGYRQFPVRVSALAIGVGLLGIVIWVGICALDLETKLLVPLGLGGLVDTGQRVAYDPFLHLGNRPIWLVAFLIVRFAGLAAVVPLIEELFLRGFVVRWVVDPAWWKIPVGHVNTTAILVVVLYAALSHPSEMFAAVVWFSLVTWLMVKTRNIWDCVAAHAVTNFLLGIYVLVSHDWQLW